MSNISEHQDEKIYLESLEEFSNFRPDENDSPKKKKSSKLKFLLYIVIITALTGVALYLSLKGNVDAVGQTLKGMNVGYLFLMFAIILFSYVLDGVAIFLFSRLYTYKYKIHQGIATSYIGAFYSNVSPGKSAGQVMEAYTMKKQGLTASNAASIMVMSFILYEFAIILVSAIGLFFSKDALNNVGSLSIFSLSITSVPLIIIAFGVHLLLIVGLLAMSYSRFIHSLILNTGINILARLKVLKKPEQTRESLRIQVENFKMELRRLTSNIPIFVLMIIIFSLVLMLRFSIPYFAGLALDGYGQKLGSDGVTMVDTLGSPSIISCLQGIFLTSYTQLITSVIPIPGGAGISEYLFSSFFSNYYNSQSMIISAQIVWRLVTFVFVLIVAGIVTTFYRASPKEEFHHATRREYLTMQYTTFEERALDPKFQEKNSDLFSDFKQYLKQKKKPKSRTEGHETSSNEEVSKPRKEKRKKHRKEKEAKIKWITEDIVDDD